ncbi:hypothetical protein [Blastopirellula retiformator]|uniref:Haloacid dehalogenase-like hydrolase n=1 Tax=Blastopirellula retiformator TaxID=2527970 RepID=A0A5C5UUQ5_9BACT|nr:hypothetical protein [Blastopirellula retiformator]TWT30111.1 hypothetical protein Enr8_47680 [Blastopirellula retiformator]
MEDGEGYADEWIVSTGAGLASRLTIVVDPKNTLFDATVGQRWLFQLIGADRPEADFSEFFAVWSADFAPAIWRGERPYWDAMKEYLCSKGLSGGHVDELWRAASPKFPELEYGGKYSPDVLHILERISSYDVQLIALWETVQTVAPHSCEHAWAKAFDQVITTRELGCDAGAIAAYQRLRGQIGDSVCVLQSADARCLAAAAKTGWLTLAIGRKVPAAASESLPTWADLISWAALRGNRQSA